MEIKEGSVVRSPFWPEPVKVEKVVKIGDNYRIVGSTINSNQYVDAVLSKEEIGKFTQQTSLLMLKMCFWLWKLTDLSLPPCLTHYWQ